MQILRPADYRRMPWKNGGGETTEIAVSPPADGLAAPGWTMDWRLSMATVAADGPFSSFPGIDRTLSVLDGALDLAIEGQRMALTTDSPPCRFPGDARVEGFVVRGPVTDLNVMTRRDRYSHEVRRIVLAGTDSFTPGPCTLAVFCHTGAAALQGEAGPGPLALAAGETAIGAAGAGAVHLVAKIPSILYLIVIKAR